MCYSKSDDKWRCCITDSSGKDNMANCGVGGASPANDLIAPVNIWKDKVNGKINFTNNRRANNQRLCNQLGKAMSLCFLFSRSFYQGFVPGGHSYNNLVAFCIIGGKILQLASAYGHITLGYGGSVTSWPVSKACPISCASTTI